MMNITVKEPPKKEPDVLIGLDRQTAEEIREELTELIDTYNGKLIKRLSDLYYELSEELDGFE